MPCWEDLAEAESKMMKVWAVVFSNYYPRETDSLWATAELAEQRASELGYDWNVESQYVYRSREEWEDF